VRRLAVWLCVHLGHWVVVPYHPSEPINRIVARGVSLRCPCGTWGDDTIMWTQWPPRILHRSWEPWLDRGTGAYLPPDAARRAEMLREIDDTP